MFEMRGIEKRFDAVVALDGASLSVSPGEILALLGSNGSGKSTMIKVLAGLVAPNHGEVLIDNQPVEIKSGFASRQLGIATAFQDLSLIPTMSVMDNILLGNEPVSSIGIVNRKTAKAEVQKLLDRFHINCNPNAYVQTLMPSTQTMLEVAKAVTLKPRLLLLDEVTAALHYDEIEVLFNIMRELKKDGVAMIYVTHRMDEIFKICDTANIMRSGKSMIQTPVSKDLDMDDIVFYMTGNRPDAAEKTHGHDDFSVDDRELVLNVSHLEMLPKVRDISLKAYKGEIIGIGGLQGQGQSEFIRLLLGAEGIEDGTIEFRGEKVNYASPAEAVKNGLGFISGERNRDAIFPLRSVEENLTTGVVAKGNLAAYLSPAKLAAFSANAVNKYNIVLGSIKNPASSLSGGNQQKVVVARWIAMNPALLLLDDPTKGVDIVSRHEIHNILRNCAEDGMTIIYSSSESDELLEISDRIYVFYEGQVSGMLEGANKNSERLVAAMMGLSKEKDETILEEA